MQKAQDIFSGPFCLWKLVYSYYDSSRKERGCLMNINDYNTRLSQARQNYREAADDIKKDTTEQVEDLEKRHKYVQEKQAATFDNAKADLEKQNQENSNIYNKKTNETIAERTEAYRNELKEQQTDFDNDRNKLKDNFDERLGNLRDSFSKSAEGRDKVYNTKMEQAENRFKEISQRERSQFQNSINELDETASENSKRFKNQMVQEQKSLIKDHDNTLRDFANNSAVARTQVAERNARNVANLRAVQKTELEQRDDHAKARLESVTDTKDQEKERMRTNFEKLSQDISDKNDQTIKSLNKDTRETLDSAEKRYAKDLYNEKRLANEKIKGGNKTEQFENLTLQMKNSFDDRVKNIYKKVADDQVRSEADKDRIGVEFQETVKDLKIKNGKNIDLLQKEHRDNFTETMNKSNQRTNTAISQYKDELQKVTTNAEQDSIKKDLQSKRIFDNQRKAFGETIDVLSNKNIETVSKLQEEHAREKTNFIEGIRRDHHNELEGTKADLKETFSKKEESLIRQSDLKDIELQNQIGKAEDRYERLKDKTAKELGKREVLEADRREEDKRSHKRDLLAKDRENRIEMISLKDQYEKRLANEKHSSDVQKNKLIERYESRLETETGNLRREMKTKLKEATANYNRLNEQSILDKENIRHQYETRIEKMRRGHQDQLEALSKDRRYS